MSIQKYQFKQYDIYRTGQQAWPSFRHLPTNKIHISPPPPIYLLINHQKVAKTTTWCIFFLIPIFTNFYLMCYQIICYQGDSRIAYVREMSACICYPPPH